MTTAISCTICGEPRTTDDGWYLLTENRWTDRLKILAFHPVLAAQAGVACACGKAHVRELVVHWMTTGHLDYPFAEVPEARFFRRRKKTESPASLPELDARGLAVVGELAVHRESLERVLRENPQSLSVILEELVAALEPGATMPRPASKHERAEETQELELKMELTEV